MKLIDKVAIITGSGRGLGREMALAFAQEGADLVITDILAQEAEAVSQEVKALGRQAMAIHANVLVEEDVNRTVRQTLDRFGRIDIMVNNAAIGLGPGTGLGFIKDISLKDWQMVLNTNLTGTLLYSQAVLSPMMEQGGGVIINIFSGAQPRPPMGAYIISKAGIETLTRVLAIELASYNIRVNALSPGGRVATKPLLEAKAPPPLFRPEVIRAAAVYLASEESAGVAGECIKADEWNEQHGLGDPSKWYL